MFQFRGDCYITEVNRGVPPLPKKLMAKLEKIGCNPDPEVITTMISQISSKVKEI